MNIDFSQKTAIVSGSALGIGKVIAEQLILSGAFVYVLDNNKSALQKFSLQNKSSSQLFETYELDVSNENEIIQFAHHIQTQNKSIDFLVNNAGIDINKPIQDLSVNEWNKVISINLTSIFLFSKYLLPIFSQEKAAIVNLSSTRAYMSEQNTEAYSASKGGVIALTHALAMSLGPKIRVNSVSPGWILVEKHQNFLDTLAPDEVGKQHKQHPAGRIGDPVDIANAVIFLLSDKSGFMTGQNMVVDGGMTKKMIYI